MLPSRPILREHLDYSAWATDALLQACGALSPEALVEDTQCSHRSILGTLRHLYHADLVWCLRLQGLDDQFEFLDPEAKLSVLQEAWPRLWQQYRQWLDDLPEAQIEEEIHSRRWNGDPFHLARWKVILHVVNHGTLHRGQVMSLLRQRGVTPPGTDLFFFYLAQQAAG